MPDRRWLTGALLILTACASAPPPSPSQPSSAATPPAAQPSAPTASQPQTKRELPHYRCDGGLEFDVNFGDGSATLQFPSRAPLVLLRDAGGTSPLHVVYSSTEAKAEFGLGADGREAKVHLVSPAVEARCTRG